MATGGHHLCPQAYVRGKIRVVARGDFILGRLSNIYKSHVAKHRPQMICHGVFHTSIDPPPQKRRVELLHTRRWGGDPLHFLMIVIEDNDTTVGARGRTHRL
jgi:hypothetical protein